MTTWVALLRAVNVGGTGLLRMRDLRALCQGAGFADVRTHGASGNVIFSVEAPEAEVKAALARRLEVHIGRPVDMVLRTGSEIEATLAGNPFPRADASRVAVIFLDAPPPADVLATVTGREDEELALGPREVIVHYPRGMGQTRLRIPAARLGTARNINTLRRLAGLLDPART